MRGDMLVILGKPCRDKAVYLSKQHHGLFCRPSNEQNKDKLKPGMFPVVLLKEATHTKTDEKIIA